MIRKTVTSFLSFTVYLVKGTGRRVYRLTCVLFFIRKSTDHLVHEKFCRGALLMGETGEMPGDKWEHKLLLTGELIAAELDASFPNGDVRIKALLSGCNKHSSNFLSRFFSVSGND